MNSHLGLRMLGWRALLLEADPTVPDRLRWLRRHLQPGPGRILDAGCGTGALAICMGKMGKQVIGASYSTHANKAARECARMLGRTNVKFVDLDLRNMTPLEQNIGRFTDIVCFELIEHILDDKGLLGRLAGALQPSGRIFLTTPYKHYRRLWGDSISAIEDGDHVRWGYTHEELRTLFAQCGLEVIIEEFVSGVLSQKITNLHRRLERVLNGRAASWLTLPLCLSKVCDRPLTWLLRYPYLSVAVVGRRVVENRSLGILA